MNADLLSIARGARVCLELIDQRGAAEPAEFILVASKQADLRSGLLDEAAPLGAALLGHHAGEAVPYVVGDLKELRILSVEIVEGTASPEAAEQRRAAVRKAAAQSEITNQMIFATASGSKWGDYDVDVDKLMENHPKEDDKTPGE